MVNFTSGKEPTVLTEQQARRFGKEKELVLARSLFGNFRYF